MAITNYTQYSHWLPNWAFKLLAKMYIDYTYPRHIYIETTTRCNLMCTHCPRPKIEEDMTFEIFSKIVFESMEYGPRSFSLHGFGEPTLDKDLRLKMEMIKTANKKNNVILTTNGVIINNDAYDLADKIIITYRPPYDLTKYKKWKHKIMIRNFTDVPVPGTWKCETKEYHNFGGNVQSNIKTSHRYPCYHLWLSPMIAWNGDMLLCCNMPNHEIKLGNINEHSIMEMWRGPATQEYREQQLRGIYVNPCNKCNCWQNYKRVI